jgi:hypothetical protein
MPLGSSSVCLQAAILCELAAFVAGQCPKGVEVARAFARMASAWTREARRDLEELRCRPQCDTLAAKQTVLQRAASFASALVVICTSFLPCTSHLFRDGDHRSLPKDLISTAIVHFVIARFYHLPGGQKCNAQGDRVWELASCSAAASSNLWALVANDHTDILDDAIHELYPGAPTGTECRPC